MTSITRTKLLRCRVKDCPAPESEEWHIPWCEDIPGHEHFGEPSHQHWPKKGMGGHNPKSEIVACLCIGAHDRIDNGDWGNSVLDFEHGAYRVYRAWDIQNLTLIWRAITPPWWKAEHGTDDSGPGNQGLPPDAGVPAEEVRGSGDSVVLLRNPQSRYGGVPDPAEHEVQVRDGDEGKAELTFEAWAEQTRTYAMAYRSMGWLFGDHLVRGEDSFGDQVWQVIDQELRIDHGTVANWMSVCRAWPPSCRQYDASFTVHQLLSPLARRDIEAARSLLQEIVDGGKTTGEVRALLAGPVDSHECPSCGASHRVKGEGNGIST